MPSAEEIAEGWYRAAVAHPERYRAFELCQTADEFLVMFHARTGYLWMEILSSAADALDAVQRGCQIGRLMRL